MLLDALFDTSKSQNRIDLVYETVTGLDDPVGAAEFHLGTATLKAPDGTTLQVLHQPIDLHYEGQETGLELDARIHAAGFETRVFETGETYAAPPNSSLAEVVFDVGVGLSADSTVAPNPLTLAVSVGASGRFRYRHLLPVSSEQKRINAFKALARSTRLPHNLDLQAMARNGSAVTLETWFSLSFGLKVQFGRDLDIERVVGLFDGLSASLQVHIRLSIEASLGWSLYDEMALTVAGANQLNEGWVRLRMRRKHQRRLTLGAQLSLQIQYDLGTEALETILDRALELRPTARVLDALRKVAELNALLEEGGWPAVQEKITDRLADGLTEYLGNNTWRKWTEENRAEISELTSVAARVVEAYDGIPGRVQGLWERLLAGASLGEDSRLIQVLRELADLDPDNLDLTRFLGDGDLAETVTLLETLSGLQLEDLLLEDDTGLQQSLTRIRDAADRVLALRNRIPEEVNQRLADLFKRTGIARAVEFLRDNATSVEDLQQAIEDRVAPSIRTLVSRLVDKSFDAINETDLKKVRDWVKRMTEVLENIETWNRRIRAAIQKLEGEVGFSVSVEMERLTERMAVLDIELDPGDAKTRNAVLDALKRSDVKLLLAQLPEPRGDEPLPWQIREAVFSSRRVRTSLTSTLLSVAGLTFGRVSGGNRIEESTVRVTQEGEKIRRSGSYNAGFVRTEGGNLSGARTASSGAWLTLRGEAAGKDLRAAYASLETKLRLDYRRHDDKTLGAELVGLDRLLANLGFFAAGQPAPMTHDVPEGVETRFVLQVSLPQSAADEFLGDFGSSKSFERRWNEDFLNAAHRWLMDQTVTRSLADNSTVRLGDALASVLLAESFREQWTKGVPDFESWAIEKGHKSFRLRSATQDFTLQVIDTSRRPRWSPDALPLRSLIASRGPGYQSMRRLAGEYVSAKNGRTPAELETLSRRAAKAFQQASASHWPSPAFDLWLVLSRLSRLDPQVLTRARGYASLRWRQEGDESWNGPRLWRLQSGIPTDLRRAGGVFPVS